MIPVQLQPEPPHFFRKVKEPGEKFLAAHPNPTSWTNREYWREALDDLCKSYSRICAYSCHWISPCTGASTVDHFKPISKYPSEAYCWDNFRLACSLLNARKKDFEDVLDPFTLEEGWFVIDFDTLNVLPNPQLSEANVQRVAATIERLRLNDDGDCFQERANWLGDYITGEIPFSHLKKKAPFTAKELERQNLVEEIKLRTPVWLRAIKNDLTR